MLTPTPPPSSASSLRAPRPRLLTCCASTPTSTSSPRASAPSPRRPRSPRPPPLTLGTVRPLPRRRARAPLRQDGHAQRRGQAEQVGDTEVARREALPTPTPDHGRREQGLASEFRGRRRQGVAVPLLVLEQQPELCPHQGLEPLCEGEGPWSRRRRQVLPLRRRQYWGRHQVL
uniref:Uncharacterized protein n=1 Tax=Triticum urartu TaxID=4572 RepID=A0A8R7TNS7_TRIUA